MWGYLGMLFLEVMVMISRGCAEADVFTCVVCVCSSVKQSKGGGEGGGQIGSSETVMASKYLDQRQEVIMGKFCCSLPVLTFMTLRAFGAGSVTGHTVLFSPKRPVHPAWRAGGLWDDDVRGCLVVIWKTCRVKAVSVLDPPPACLPGPYCHYSSVLGIICCNLFLGRGSRIWREYRVWLPNLMLFWYQLKCVCSIEFTWLPSTKSWQWKSGQRLLI